MDFQKDYYAILGCAPTADQAVIQAAYRALAKKHHPDANQGSDESKAKFQEIQEAYEVLSDLTKRTYYDSMRAGTGGREYEPGEEPQDETDAEELDIQSRWSIIKEYVKNIDDFANRLGQVSPNLKIIFKIIIIENRNFKEAGILAARIEDIYIERYFGKETKIKDFARKLLLNRQSAGVMPALKELNKIVVVMGDETPGAMVVKNLVEKFNLDWTRVADRPFDESATDNKMGLPNNNTAWAAITKIAPRYGWKYVSGFLGAKFVNIDNNHEVRCFTPDEAIKLMRIPAKEVIDLM